MSGPAWPRTLPTPQADGYTLKQDSRVRRSNDMDIGPARVRRLATSGPTVLTLNWVLLGNQGAIFAAWWHHEIDDGAAWFDCAVKHEGGTDTVRVRFKEEPSRLRFGQDGWKLSASVEIEDLPVMTPEDLAPYL